MKRVLLINVSAAEDGEFSEEELKQIVADLDALTDWQLTGSGDCEFVISASYQC